MKRTITLNTFRKLARAEETMMRTVMPKTSAADAAPLTSPILPGQTRRVWSNGRRVAVVPALTFTMQEVMR